MAGSRITKRTVDAAAAGSRDKFLWDDALPGFGLKITPRGRKVYLFQFRLAPPGKARATAPQRYTIGLHGGPWTPATARLEAERLARLVSDGTNPVFVQRERIAGAEEAKRKAEERTRAESELEFIRLASRWLVYLEEEQGCSRGHVATCRSVVSVHLQPSLGARPLPHITADELEAVLNRVPASRPATRLNIYKVVTGIFGWAKRRRLIASNPASELERPKKPAARKRVLDDTELATIWEASAVLAAPWPAFFRLAILTGKRRSEIARMDWSELDRGARLWSIAGDRTKNGKPDLVALSDATICELDALAAVAHKRAGSDHADWPSAGFVLTRAGSAPIGDFGAEKANLDVAVTNALRGQSMTPWRIHDLRRTFATGMQRLGVRFEVTEALLNHTGRSGDGVAGIYQLHDWKAEKREALARWALHISQVLEAFKAENVVRLKQRRQA